MTENNDSAVNSLSVRNSYKKFCASLYSLASYILVCMLCVFLFFTFIGRIVSVSGDSMYPNLYNNDKIFISNFLYTPAYGDIIAIGRSSEEEPSIIKRVIAKGGDEINIDFTSHMITVNGEVIFETYDTFGAIERPGDMPFPLTVPDGFVFVLGDNRNNSLDSRFSSIGFISEDEIAGKALVRLFPFGNFSIK